MSYIQKKLVSNPQDITKMYRITKWVLFNELILLGIALAIFIAGFIGPLRWPRAWSPFGLMSIIGGILAIIMLIALIVELIRRSSIEIAVTTTRLIGKKGVLRIEVLDRQLGHIDFLKVRMSIIGRIFGFGQVTIGSNNKEYVYKMVSKPLDLQRTVNAQLDQSLKTGSGAAKKTTAADSDE